MDYYEKYIEHSENKSNMEFEKYLDIYFSKDENYERYEKDSYLILLDIQTKKQIKLKQPKFINLYEEKLRIHKLKYEILYKIDEAINNENDKEFNSLKNQLLDINKSFREIIRVFRHKKNIIKDIEEKEKTNNHELFKLYQKREKYFNTFPKNLNIQIFYKIKQFYKSEGNVKNDRLNEISNELKLKVSEIKIIMNWLIICKKYIKLQLQINDEKNHNINQIENLNNILVNLMIEKPEIIIENVKNIKVSRKSLIPNENNLQKNMNEVQEQEENEVQEQEENEVQEDEIEEEESEVEETEEEDEVEENVEGEVEEEESEEGEVEEDEDEEEEDEEKESEVEENEEEDEVEGDEVEEDVEDEVEEDENEEGETEVENEEESDEESNMNTNNNSSNTNNNSSNTNNNSSNMNTNNNSSNTNNNSSNTNNNSSNMNKEPFKIKVKKKDLQNNENLKGGNNLKKRILFKKKLKRKLKNPVSDNFKTITISNVNYTKMN